MGSEVGWVPGLWRGQLELEFDDIRFLSRGELCLRINYIGFEKASSKAGVTNSNTHSMKRPARRGQGPERLW